MGLFPESIANKGKEVTSKVAPVHHMKAYGGRRGRAPLILNLDSRGEWSTPLPGHFTLGKSPNTHLIECSVAPETAQTFCRTENVLPPRGIETRIVRPVA